MVIFSKISTKIINYWIAHNSFNFLLNRITSWENPDHECFPSCPDSFCFKHYPFRIRFNQLILNFDTETKSKKDDLSLTRSLSELSKDLSKLLEDKSRADVTFYVEREEVLAHIVVVAARSPVFSGNILFIFLMFFLHYYIIILIFMSLLSNVWTQFWRKSNSKSSHWRH